MLFKKLVTMEIYCQMTPNFGMFPGNFEVRDIDFIAIASTLYKLHKRVRKEGR